MAKSKHTYSAEEVHFVRAHWWDIRDFFRLYLAALRGHDPLVDRILAHPYSLFSLNAYQTMFYAAAMLNNYFIEVTGKRVGIISWEYYPGFIYFFGVALLPEFQRSNLGLQAAHFFRDHHLNVEYQIIVGSIAVKNRPSHMLMRGFGGRLLGLSTTTLVLAPLPLTPEDDFMIQMRRLSRPEALRSWRHWRLYEVEQVTGREMVGIAAHLLGNLSQGRYLALYQNGREIGFAAAHGRNDNLEVELFPSREFWSSAPLANLVACLSGWLGAPVRRLTVTQTQANALTVSETFAFERNREEERHYFVVQRS